MKNKHMNKIIWLIIFGSLVWVTNCTPLGYFLKRDYTYSNYNGTFRHNEMKLKGIGYDNRDIGYAIFLKNNLSIKDKQLYRTFRLDPWRFWEWHEWYYHFDRFKLPYISEKKIQQNQAKEGLDKEK